MRKLLTAILAVVALVGLFAGSPVYAQTTLNSTTLAAAVTATAERVTVASASNISVGDILFTGREAMTVRAISSTTITVTRGANSAAHLSGATVYTGVPARFNLTTPRSGTCTRASERFLPRINTVTGDIFDCSAAGIWYNARQLFAATCRALLVADQIDQSCFTADKHYAVVSITEIHTTAESAGTLTLIPRRQQGTEASASGDALATAIDMVGAGAVAQTLKTATLTTTGSLLLLEPGNRLGLDYTDDVAGELAGVVVTFWLAPLP